MIDIVSATRLSQDAFWEKSALGQSLLRLSSDTRLASAHIAYENRRGLPEIYNARIDAAESADMLVFVHDDVWIDDYLVADRVIAGLQQYDLIGVAGNRRHVPNQPGWLFKDAQFSWDEGHLSGAMAHGKQPFAPVSWFGPMPADCESLDGVFLAARTSALRNADVRFDPKFDFHCYDMDFCRTARLRGLRVGTWPICLTHESGGAFGADAWKSSFASYLAKWGD